MTNGEQVSGSRLTEQKRQANNIQMVERVHLLCAVACHTAFVGRPGPRSLHQAGNMLPSLVAAADKLASPPAAARVLVVAAAAAGRAHAAAAPNVIQRPLLLAGAYIRQEGIQPKGIRLLCLLLKLRAGAGAGAGRPGRGSARGEMHNSGQTFGQKQARGSIL